MHSNRYTLLFTAIVTVVLAFLLSIVDSSLKEKYEKNVEVDIRKNILISLGFSSTDVLSMNNENVESIFQNSIVGFVVDNSGSIVENKLPQDIDPNLDLNLYPIYKRVSNNITEGYSIPISGKGLWGTMFGYFSIEPDGSTAKGITFYQHIETPGLGGEVDKPWFQNNFVGKRFVDENGNLIGIQTVKGQVDETSEEAYHLVDGISGATMTSRGLNQFLLKDLKFYDPFFSKIRSKWSG
tara:strand:+ start:553 stop:1269 length:717 start_codon:yes stop_codon:yes gene_type:complete